jgi:hypothetical protein
MEAFVRRKLAPKALQKNYKCCIYLEDNVCDPLDDECIKNYTSLN